MSRLRQVSGILLVAVAMLAASCSTFSADQTTTTTEPSPLDEACLVVADFTVVLDAADVLRNKLEDLGYVFPKSSPSATQRNIYRQWRTAELATWEAVLGDATSVVVDARGLEEMANPFGSTILEYATDRRDFYSYIVDTPTGGIIRNEDYDAASAEYGVVRDRCDEAAPAPNTEG